MVVEASINSKMGPIIKINGVILNVRHKYGFLTIFILDPEQNGKIIFRKIFVESKNL